MNQSELFWLILACAGSSAIFRFAALGLARWANLPFMKVLQEFMPMIIIIILLAILYSKLNYHAGNFYGAPQLLAGALAIALCKWQRSAVLAIVAATVCFVLMNDYILKD